ncbi:hypothetical protein DSO57_1032878 [Entomophthora muscae]|uniref:Uncharacterized protein n=1 Tax=Entomophthora muscae TaxID=34485 RepID=A0ACC2UA25_9FUNG|nr:hypothetical protein DSO57_1032878 [Entomophthora muscae]
MTAQDPTYPPAHQEGQRRVELKGPENKRTFWAPDAHQSLSISEIEALEGRGIPSTDVELWIELQFDFNQIDIWLRAGFGPTKAQQWEAAGFTPACSSVWAKAGIDLEWAKVFRQL